jgi:hypothetical protein
MINVLKKHMNLHVYCITIHNSQVTETSLLPINGRIDKETVEYIQSGIVFTKKK